ncbi:uncharacterized protein YdaU (DUF1376 family) [Sinorhizobium meliloti]|uniref:YdaU family protein n=1 Tax=Rhizobium meliloti TaxID=382 RepID=UPI000FDCAA0C|nr:DUF1376 domain-containing protein [Sinorhizobium meliloti]MDW9772572.1 DUF1376 domain-containing protein [Sinorhizobium meliloti]MDW9846918.1 DUF1376 domain-containing protein [Sinorhizobium meliloti]MDX0143722.1 DUF1376 domain-containing protein [Sinorhizobium meliloti]MDX0149747.1 DUF1376 domain-containing protein [Sinorhizobium meliloti]MDX0168978.1 DUF1376 domain-containing protein [Sinorhizobium meliloti]
MSERPFMQLYVSDFIGDTLHLSTEQIGAYMLLLMAMWNAGGRLPNDDAKLARVVRMSVKKWKAIEDDLLGFFDVTEGEIYHNRLTKELQKSERKSQLRADAGAKGGSSKALKDKEARLANASDLPQHSPDTRDNSSLRSESISIGDEFDRDFWPVYPRKVGKGQAIKAYRAARKRASAEEITSGAKRYASDRSGQDPSFTKHPATWLNGQCWLDEPVPQQRQHPQAQSPPRPQSPSLQRHHDIHARLKRELYGEPDEQFAGQTVDLAAGDFRSH